LWTGGEKVIFSHKERVKILKRRDRMQRKRKQVFLSCGLECAVAIRQDSLKAKPSVPSKPEVSIVKYKV
jgi:beta-lactamase regulating signal transducer with metallopeptidase domain